MLGEPSRHEGRALVARELVGAAVLPTRWPIARRPAGEGSTHSSNVDLVRVGRDPGASAIGFWPSKTLAKLANHVATE
jgi:hypothetical protein